MASDYRCFDDKRNCGELKSDILYTVNTVEYVYIATKTEIFRYTAQNIGSARVEFLSAKLPETPLKCMTYIITQSGEIVLFMLIGKNVFFIQEKEWSNDLTIFFSGSLQKRMVEYMF